MSIIISRIDERAIHGQTVHAWCSWSPIDGIILVDDEIHNNPMMKRVYENAAFGKKVHIFTLEKAKEKVPEADRSAKKYMLVARSPFIFKQLFDAGVSLNVKELNIGMASKKDNRISLAMSIFMNEEEIKCCKDISSRGYHLYLQLTPSSESVDFESIEAVKNIR